MIVSDNAGTKNSHQGIDFFLRSGTTTNAHNPRTHDHLWKSAAALLLINPLGKADIALNTAAQSEAT
ncbi:hypothetical protein DK37_07130 [Halomonas sp. SUBG004]|nr:hypothetical protein DK37_07130 [Halomonas sp. SUBG004]